MTELLSEQALNADSKLSEKRIYDLCNSLYDFDEIVTPTLLDDLGLDYQVDPFLPYTDHDLRLIDNCDGGFTLFNNAWVRWTTIHLINGVKMLCITDDDYVERTGSAEDKTRFARNYSDSLEAFTKVADAFGVDIEVQYEECANYMIDVYIPFTEFDFIKSKEEMANFLSTCEFGCKEDIEAFRQGKGNG